MTKIKNVECGCGQENYIEAVAESKANTIISMCKKCGHRWLINRIVKRPSGKFNREDED